MVDLSFGTKKKPTPQPATAGFDSSKLYVWVRGLETKVNSLRRELDLLKNNFTKKQDKLTKEMKTLNDDLIEMKRNQEKTLEKMDLIIKELKLTAGKDELMTLKKYLDLWNPLNFVTQRDVERIIEEKWGEQLVEEETKTKKT